MSTFRATRMRLPGGRRDYGVTPKCKKALVRRLRGSAHIKLFFGPANREEVAGSREILERRSKGWPLAALPARRRICFLFFGSYLYDGRLRRGRVAQAVANARAARGADGRSHVRALHRALLHGREAVDQQLDAKANRLRVSIGPANEQMKRLARAGHLDEGVRRGAGPRSASCP